MKEGNKFGAHRVIEPQGVLPQPAWQIDNTMEIADNEILIDVDTLNVDAASFTQIEEAEGGDVKKMAAHSLDIILVELGDHVGTALFAIKGGKVDQFGRGNDHAASMFTGVAGDAFEHAP